MVEMGVWNVMLTPMCEDLINLEMIQSEQLLEDQKVPWLSPDWGALIVCENNSGGELQSSTM